MNSYPESGSYPHPGGQGGFPHGAPAPSGFAPLPPPVRTARRRDLVQAIPLGLGGVLLGVGSFLRLLTIGHNSAYGSWVTSWAYGSDLGAARDFSSLYGIIFVLAVLLAFGAVAVLATGKGDRPRASALVSLATGAVLGTALGVVLNVGLAPLVQRNGDLEYTYGAAFWLCVLTVPLALLATAAAPSSSGTGFNVTVDSYGRPQRERSTGLDVTAAVLLILYALVTVGIAIAGFMFGSGERMFLVFDDEYSSLIAAGVSALSAFVGALVLLLAGRAFARRAGATAAALAFTVGAGTLMPKIDIVRDQDGGFDYFGGDFYVQVFATLLVPVAMVLTVLAAGSAPRYRTPYPAAPPVNPYAPMGGFPAPAVPQGYAPGFPQQGASMPHTQPPGGFGGVPGEFAPGVDGQGGFPPGGTHQARYAPSLQKPGQISPPKQGTH
ncbi:hypothetical protein ACWDOP_15565 [Nocardia sp. NPDC003693]